MCDLINREDVIKCLQENGWWDDIGELIETIPTAYNIDNVVEELLALNKNYNDGINLYEEVAEIPTEDAIEIVKQGDVSDASDYVCEWKSGKSNDEWQPNCEPNSTYNVFGVAWFKRCPYCGKKIKTVGD